LLKVRSAFVCNQNESNSHDLLTFVLNTFVTTFLHFEIKVKPAEQYRPTRSLVQEWGCTDSLNQGLNGNLFKNGTACRDCP